MTTLNKASDLADTAGMSHSVRRTAVVRVLVADDYPDSAESLAALLAHAGCDVQVAHDGADALERIRLSQPHVCILDLSMPKLNGFELARWIRLQSWAHRPQLIALTGWARPDDLERARVAGFDHHFSKPADPLEIVRVIQKVRYRIAATFRTWDARGW
jgi:CheY-like chemotaxis protein